MAIGLKPASMNWHAYVANGYSKKLLTQLHLDRRKAGCESASCCMEWRQHMLLTSARAKDLAQEAGSQHLCLRQRPFPSTFRAHSLLCATGLPLKRNVALQRSLHNMRQPATLAHDQVQGAGRALAGRPGALCDARCAMLVNCI